MRVLPSQQALISTAIGAASLFVTTTHPSFGDTPTHAAFAYSPLKKIATYGSGADPVSAQTDAESACQKQGGGVDCQAIAWWTYGWASFALNAATGRWGWGGDPYDITIADTLALKWCGTDCTLIHRIGVGGSAPFRSNDFAPVNGNWAVKGYSPGKGDHVTRDLYAVDFFSSGPDIYPVRPGTVVFSGWNCCVAGVGCANPPGHTDHACYGYTAAVDHGGGVYSIYTHLAADSMATLNQKVTPQSRIGLMSSSGCPTALCGSEAHLHFAIRSGPLNLGANALYGSNTPVLTPWTLIP